MPLISTAQSIDSTLKRYAADFGQERTWLHYDKAAYGAGETVWFKAYLMSGIFPAEESKTLYVDFMDPEGKLLLHGAYPMMHAGTNGQFDVPLDYKGDFIRIKAYTKWMLNFDSTLLYNKAIPILSVKKGKTAETDNRSVLQFFPEGGDMVTGVKSKVAFKAERTGGEPVNIRGVIKDSKGKWIDSIRSTHDGMGYFFITPLGNEKYTAIWRDEKGNEYQTALPAVKENGIAIQVELAGKKRNVTITPARSNNAGTIHVLGTMNQQLAFKTSREMGKDPVQLSIPVQELSSGVLIITVFNDQWQPMAERITFVNNGEYLFTPAINIAQQGLGRREKNKVTIKVPDTLSNISVSVTDMGIGVDNTNTIVSHMLLGSELKGRVYKPAYYFSAATNKVADDLDLVMLTHGWRKFRWDDVVAGKMPVIRHPRDTSYLALSGRVYDLPATQLREAGDMILVSKQGEGESQTSLVTVNDDGYFEDPAMVFFDSLKVFYKLNRKGMSKASVRFMENFLPPGAAGTQQTGTYYDQGLDTTGYARHLVFAREAARMLQQQQDEMLANVTVMGKVKSKLDYMDEKYTKGLFGMDGIKFDMTNNEAAKGGALNILYYLQGRVAGLTVTSGKPPSLYWRGETVYVFLDEIQTTVQQVSSISVSDIAFIKVFRPPFVGNNSGGKGAVALYTRRGDEEPEARAGDRQAEIVMGYTKIKEFYSPAYGDSKTLSSAKDIRTTLYWNPQLEINTGEQNASFEFYNNDISNGFRITIEGMTPDGRLTHIERIVK